MITRFPSIARSGRALLIALAALPALACPGPAAASACEMIVVVSADLRPYRDVLQGLRETARCGFHEVKLSDGAALERIRRTSPDVVVAIGTDAFRAVRSFGDAPVVHAMVIPSEAERAPAANASGVSMDIAPAAWLRTIRRLFPAAKRVGLLYQTENTGAFVAEARRAAPAAGIELAAREVKGPDDVPRALQTMQSGIDVLWMLPDPAVAAPPMAEHLIRHSIRYRIPIMTFSRKYLEMGAVASLDVDPREMGVQAGELVNGIAQGAHPGGRRYSRKPLLSINVKAAEKMGVALDRAAAREPADD